MLVLPLISLSSLCRAQEAKVVKQLDAHSFVVTIDGKTFKAVDNELLNEQAKSFDKLNATIATMGRVNAELQTKVSLTEQQRDDAKNSLQDARVFTAQQKQLLDEETALRKDSQQFVPHGSGGFVGKFLAFFDKPAVLAGFKIALPLAQAAKTFSMQCR
jgi:hypothetical protein